LSRNCHEREDVLRHTDRILARVTMATPSPVRYRESTTSPVETDADTVHWTLALAGGDGVRLADYVVSRFGQRVPKQYCALLGTRTMLEHTLDRLHAIAPPARTLTVIGTHHAPLAMPQLAGRCDHVFRQPASRDTGVALYVALAMIRRWAPNAIVTVTPSDHYVSPAGRYVDQVRRAGHVASLLRDRVVVLGARPTEPSADFGYLSLADSLADVPEVSRVDGFVEKPSRERAADLISRGALWNTMVACGTVDALWELGRAADPHLLDILDSLVPLIGSDDEADAIDYVYRAYLPVNFSHDVLERVPDRLAAMALDGVEWSDWGVPERIEHVLARTRDTAALPALAPLLK
jgi:mannose-1-phosphate guanylyltransferase